MSQPEEPAQAAAGRPLARNATVDAVVAACIVIVGLVVVVEARRLGAQWTSDGPGSGYFPFYIGLILVVSGAAIFVQALRARRADGTSFADGVQLRRVLSVLLPSAVYVGAIMLVGLYVASAVFIAVFMIWLGKYPVLRSVTVGVAINAIFFCMFEIWFKVPLYKGALHPLSFLGY
jgi:hypothetical protein